MKGPTTADRPLAQLKGVGSQTLAKLEKLGLRTTQELLFHLPSRYEDRTRILPIGSLFAGQHALIEGRIALAETSPGGRRSLIVHITDGTGHLQLRFFHFSNEQYRQFNQRGLIRCYGEVRNGFRHLEMAHPDYRILSESEQGQPEQTLTPVYPSTEGLHQKSMRRLVQQSLVDLDRVVDWLPPEVAPNALSLKRALHLLHAPPAGIDPEGEALALAKDRLIFEELLAHHLSLSRLRAQVMEQRAIPMKRLKDHGTRFRSTLPFTLTRAQDRVIEEIFNDLEKPSPMMRLVQGDVGSGKTVVAAFAALMALDAGSQVAIMAPTELLAEQHYQSFRQWLCPLGIEVAFLSGKAKATPRKRVLEQLAIGTTGVVVGTHALFQSDVVFSRLGLIVIDEQHRFGVHQRLALREKGRHTGRVPHQLVMTATPIPRTLAMIGYADLDLSVIDERPPGRTPVITTVLSADRRDAVIDRIRNWVASGRQVYWVCTLIEESESLQAEAAEKTLEYLMTHLKGLTIGLVHGRLKPADKESVMREFKAGAIEVLVATTVIEVGVDVPNASLMVIENPERLGLSQLHQLRGRVGRGPGDAHCVLLYQAPLGQVARERLGIMRETDDGFLIAEKDLQIRGPGELLGTRQTGQITFKLADLSRDARLIDAIHQAAETLLSRHPETIDPLIERWLGSAARFVEV